MFKWFALSSWYLHILLESTVMKCMLKVVPFILTLTLALSSALVLSVWCWCLRSNWLIVTFFTSIVLSLCILVFWLVLVHLVFLDIQIVTFSFDLLVFFLGPKIKLMITYGKFEEFSWSATYFWAWHPIEDDALGSSLASETWTARKIELALKWSDTLLSSRLSETSSAT